jgi:hypothetical protein
MVTKRRHPFRWAFAALAALVIIIVIAVSSMHGGTQDDRVTQVTTGATQPAGDTITYTVTGTEAGMIDLTVPGTTQQQQITTTTKLPFTRTFVDKDGLSDFDLITVDAQNAGSGTIACSIKVNGKVVAHNESSGPFALVDCSKD